ncbi:MAG: bifunctional riboflavin kinase/FAD synthetase [Veillonellaceae bacterium]|jgi:riboflavin kinase/FMN adenylyltransferase|nr:bifunctional riboflavin kinase/FAD synthetase [Veillonellaceae bacterium]
MEIYTTITNLTKRFPKIAVVLGTFDGVHLGHQKIISRAVELAKSMGGTSVVFTFSNHPLSIVAPNRCPQQISTPDYKSELLADIGVDVLLNIPFTHDFARMLPEEFLSQLARNLNPKYVVVGPNYSFGYKSAGTPELLKSAEQQYGFKAEIMEAFEIDGTIISSTLIRQLIKEGKVADAAKLLGRPFKLKGKVIKGEQRGRTLGYPTANLAVIPDLIAPADGVYAVKVYTSLATYSGIANIGTNPTFNGHDRRIEVYLFNYTGDLYGKTIGVEFFEYIRGEKKFLSAEQLVDQIRRDICTAQEYFCNNCKVM